MRYLLALLLAGCSGRPYVPEFDATCTGATVTVKGRSTQAPETSVQVLPNGPEYSLPVTSDGTFYYQTQVDPGASYTVKLKTKDSIIETARDTCKTQ